MRLTHIRVGDIMQTSHGTKVRIISTEPLKLPKDRITVWNIDLGFCFYIHPESLKPLE
jgi:hypothetical protein